MVVQASVPLLHPIPLHIARPRARCVRMGLQISVHFIHC